HKAEDGGALVEQGGETVTFEGGPNFTQFIDLVLAFAKTGEDVANVIKAAGVRCAIRDYKTTSDFRYALTPEEVGNDTQLNANAKWLFMVSDYDAIEVGLLYILADKKGSRPRTKLVTAVLTRESVEQVWARDMEVVKKMQAWAQLAPASASDLPPNTESC